MTDPRLLAALDFIGRSLQDVSTNLALVAGELRKANEARERPATAEELRAAKAASVAVGPRRRG